MRPARRTFKTIGRLHHGVLDRISGISRELPSNFVNRGPRDSSDHRSTENESDRLEPVPNAG